MMDRDYEEAQYEQEKAWEEEQAHLDSESAGAMADAETQEQGVMNEKERVIEEIAKQIYDRHGNAHLSWGECGVREFYRYTAKQILSLITKKLEGIENPYENKVIKGKPINNAWIKEFGVFNEAIQAVIKELEE